ncbi:di-N-acetylchitobiase-like [Leucoraja erinacea]|uniref:di-N-acetylchitobiase-like n=1 Tax=Leucoraja erinaceus TaxID=7782 RepID=UPI0024562839|nr:di-N-acetylchitobiase-like [Leucoraja erinacea]
MDGIIFGVSSAVLADENRYAKINGLIQDVVKEFHNEIPGSQISMMVPWRPDCSVTQCAALQEISHHSDILFVTSFDIPKYLNDCVAKPFSAYRDVFDGLSSYIRMGIDSRKILMAVPWFGQDFTCSHFHEAGFCELGHRSDNKTTCDKISVSSITFKGIMQLLSKSITGRIWDDDLHNPYFVYLNGKTYHEVWYDDPESISMKSTILKRLKLRGIGVWAANFLNYGSNAWTLMQTEAMWNALCPP